MENEEKVKCKNNIICFFKEDGEKFNSKLAYIFEEYLKEYN